MRLLKIIFLLFFIFLAGCSNTDLNIDPISLKQKSYEAFQKVEDMQFTLVSTYYWLGIGTSAKIPVKYKKPNSFFVIDDKEGYTEVSDGTTKWVYYQANGRKYSWTIKEGEKEELDWDFLLKVYDYLLKSAEVSYLGEEKTEGRPSYKIKIKLSSPVETDESPQLIDSLIVCIDKETLLILKATTYDGDKKIMSFALENLVINQGLLNADFNGDKILPASDDSKGGIEVYLEEYRTKIFKLGTPKLKVGKPIGEIMLLNWTRETYFVDYCKMYLEKKEGENWIKQADNCLPGESKVSRYTPYGMLPVYDYDHNLIASSIGRYRIGMDYSREEDNKKFSSYSEEFLVED